jgi:hypothetical protein
MVAAALLAASLVPAQQADDTGVPRTLSLYAPDVAEQQPTAGDSQLGTQLQSLRTPVHTAPADSGMQYGIWAAGDNYKVSFHDGMTFVPYLGAAYPKTQSLGWTTKSVLLGETELLDNKQARPVPTDWRYEYQFGAVTEAYDVLGKGLEQTFVLHERPAAGDLIIRGAVQTMLHAQTSATAHQAITFFDDEERAIIEYGSAIAFDANGNRVLVGTSYASGHITLTVPGSWVASAALPITVDPLLNRVLVASSGFNPYGQVETIDIGRDDDAFTNNVLITYTRSVSATDSDLWARLGNDDFANTYGNLVFSDITTSWVTDQTSCAYVGGPERWAIVFRRHFTNSPTITSRLRSHVFDSGDTTLQTNVAGLNPPAGQNDWRPDTGGVKNFSNGDKAMVVFQREDNNGTGGAFANTALSSVYGCVIDTTTVNGTFGVPFEIKPSGSHDSERPSVNQVSIGGSAYSWVCVYQRILNGVSGDDWDLLGARISEDGTVSGGSWASDLANVSPSQHQLGAVVEGIGNRYAVVFTTVDVASVNYKTALITGKQVQIERFDWIDGAVSPTGDYANVVLRSNPARIWEATGIGHDKSDYSHWACGFRSVPPGTGSLYYARVGYDGQPTEGPLGTVLYSGVGAQVNGGACVFDDDNNNFLFAYSIEDAFGGNSTFGHTLTYETPAPPSTFGVSCSGATLSWEGNQQIGAEFNRVRVTGAPWSAHIMLVATATTNVQVVHPIVFPGCRLFVPASGPGYLGAFPTGVGPNPSWQLPLPAFLGAQTLHFQDWYLDGNGLLYSTERLSVPIIK